MEVEARVWYWTPHGMRQQGEGVGYVERSEVERLLEEAHERGRRAAEAGRHG